MARKNIRLEDLIEVVEKRSAGPDSSLATAVTFAGELAELSDQLVDHFVRTARESGDSWLQIGRNLGVTRQAAHKRFGQGRMRTLTLGRRGRRRCDSTVDDSPELFSAFTEGARNSLSLAQAEVRSLGHNYLGTEHLLLGLTAENEGVAAKALRRAGVSREDIRHRIETIVGRGPDTPSGAGAITPRAKKVLQMAHAEARKLKHGFVDTEHLLLAILTEGEGLAARILTDLGVSMEELRGDVLRLAAAAA